MPTCKKCGFATDDVEEFVEHVIAERSSKAEEKPKRRHETVEEYLNCPKCFPKFKEGFEKRGYTVEKKEEKKPEKKKGFLF